MQLEPLGNVRGDLVVLLSMPASASANGAPNIEKVTFVHHAQGHSKPVWDDTVTDYKLIAGGIRWPSTISYGVNPAGSGLDPEVVRSILEASSENWDAETSFELYNAPTLTSDSVVSGDGKNTVGWGSLNPGIIAVTYLWYNPATKEIVEFDIVFNTYYSWSAAGEADKMDLQNIATHELGHNGLADLRPPKDAELTMYAYSSLGETKKGTLGAGDTRNTKTLRGLTPFLPRRFRAKEARGVKDKEE